jgi:hypothetical protein
VKTKRLHKQEEEKVWEELPVEYIPSSEPFAAVSTFCFNFFKVFMPLYR